jgi:hypothetical protein
MAPLRAVLLLALVCACDGAPPADDAPAGADPAATAARGPTCGVETASVLTGDGVGDLRVGERVEEVARRCRVVRDTTVLGQEGQTERVLVVDFGVDTVRAVIKDGRVWRLHVRSAAIRTTESLGVGTSGGTLRRTGANVLAGEGSTFVTLPTECGLSFRLRGVQFGRVSSPAQIPDSATVDEVLAFGCQSGAPSPPR